MSGICSKLLREPVEQLVYVTLFASIVNFEKFLVHFVPVNYFL